MIVVSHRGPYQFGRDDDGELIGVRGAGGVVSALSPALADQADALWIAAAMSDDDRAAEHTGITGDLNPKVRLLDLDPEQHRMHYDVVANGVLWFLHHGMFDRVRRPRFDLRFRDAWDAFVAVNQRFSDAVAERAPEHDVVLVQDYQLTLAAGQLHAQRPDLRVVHFTHTPFAGPDDFSLLPTDVGADLCAALASGPAGFHTERWAESYRRTARVVLGPRASVPPPFAASLGPDVAALEEVASSADAPRPRAPSPTRSANGSSSLAAIGSNLRRTSSAASWRSTGSSRRVRVCAAASCSSRWCTRRARGSPSTSRTRTRSSRSSRG